MVSLDTETTGLDLRHGARPFLVTTCTDDGKQRWWEDGWEVNPLDRAVSPPSEDVEELLGILQNVDEIVLQNAKYDVAALSMVDSRFASDWRWDVTHDTLVAGHLLCSNSPHDLTNMARMYLGRNIQPYEDRVEKATKEARNYCRNHMKDWAIAKEGRSDMPSVKEKTWKVDMWLPKALVTTGEFSVDDHEVNWLTVCSEYANKDSETTVDLWQVMKSEIMRRGLWEIYLARMKLVRSTFVMESHGVTVNRVALQELRDRYSEDSGNRANVCVNLARSLDYDLTLPKSGNNQSLMNFCFGQDRSSLKLPVVVATETGNPSMNKEAMDVYEVTLKKNSKQYAFIKALRDKRRMDTAITYMNGYERFWLGNVGYPNFRRLYPSLNVTGTYTTRFSSNNPNEQNISKKEGFNLRYCFGPAPGREWWSFDGKNMELRFPAYECGEEEMIALFERPDDPPYYGSNHLLVFSILWPKEFDKHGKNCKEVYKATLYDQVKRGNFALQYDAGDETADAAYGVPGARARIKSRFRKQEELSRYWRSYADKYGYVETLPDKSVDPRRGFPVMCKTNDYGKVKSTVPFSNHIQGSVGWWMMMCMINVDEYLTKLNRETKKQHFMTLQVHDELVLDFPKGTGNKPWLMNLSKAKAVQRIMEKCGDNLGIPTPTSIEYHAASYAEGVAVRETGYVSDDALIVETR